MNKPGISVDELQRDAERLLQRCCDHGEKLIVELPDRRQVLIQPIDDDDELVNRLIEGNPAFQEMLAQSAASARKPFDPIEIEKIAPPGMSPEDPNLRDIDPIAFALSKVHTALVWIDEHRASFEAARLDDPGSAATELRYLAHSTAEAQQHMNRLLDLLLAGHAMDPSKRLPRDLQQRIQKADG
jgi:hypothetical protein